MTSDINSGPGWYEVINPRNATTCIAGVYEDGSIYFPEGEQVLDRQEFAFAAARGKAHRLVRADEVAETIRQAKAEAWDSAIASIDPNLFAYGEVEQDELRERNPYRIAAGGDQT